MIYLGISGLNNLLPQRFDRSWLVDSHRRRGAGGGVHHGPRAFGRRLLSGVCNAGIWRAVLFERDDERNRNQHGPGGDRKATRWFTPIKAIGVEALGFARGVAEPPGRGGVSRSGGDAAAAGMARAFAEEIQWSAAGISCLPSDHSSAYHDGTIELRSAPISSPV